MKLLCIACEVLARPAYLCAAKSPHIVDVHLVQKGLHNHPAKLRAQLQSAVDAAGEGGYDAVVLGYGLCGQAVAGLTAGSIPLVIPRAHDCITLFLGSRERYQEEFDRVPGTYWYTQDYIERDDGSGSTLSMGSGFEGDLQDVYEQYVQKYGKENADYLMEVMGAWQKHYQRAVYIDLGFSDGTGVEQKARRESEGRGWMFSRLTGDLLLIRRLLEGDWGDDFLQVAPGEQVRMTYDECILASTRAGISE